MQYITLMKNGKYKLLRTQKEYIGLFSTLEEARQVRDYLNEHNWEQDYIKKMKNKYTVNTTHKKPGKYIYKNYHGWQISRDINKKRYYAGCYTNLTLAINIKNYLNEHGWNDENIAKIHRLFKVKSRKSTGLHEKYISYSKKYKNYSIRRTIKGKHLVFGTYRNLNDAIEERDLLIAHDWDFDAVCDLN